MRARTRIGRGPAGHTRLTARAASIAGLTTVGALVVTLLVLAGAAAYTSQAAAATTRGQTQWTTIDTDPPPAPVRLVFVHRSVGQRWLSNRGGRLGEALLRSDYFVSDTFYGWGGAGFVSLDGQISDELPLSRGEAIGSTTDIGDWSTWFRGPDSTAYLTSLLAWSGQTVKFERLPEVPAVENEVVLLMPAANNSNLTGDPADPLPALSDNPLAGKSCDDPAHTVANAKAIYLDLLSFFASHQDKLFVVFTASPVLDGTWAANALAFNDWLVNDWLQDADYAYDNVFVYDFWTVQTTNGGDPTINDIDAATGNHHRLRNGVVERTTDGDDDSQTGILEYPDISGTVHPSRAGLAKATAEFVPLLNAAYNAWKGNTNVDVAGPRVFAPQPSSVRRGHVATLHYRVTDDRSPGCTVTLRLWAHDGSRALTLRPGLVPTGEIARTRYLCSLPRGVYRFVVTARDFSGNLQTRRGANVLVVR
jgi:hypothetical protein